MLFGLKVIGNIEEGNGSGFRAIGRGAQDPMQSGYRATGNRGGTVGSLSKAVGITAE